jgi:hypothetical protein
MRACHCGADLTTRPKQALYCSDRCRHHAWQANNRERRNAYQKQWRAPKPKLIPFAGAERIRCHG